ncbi:hypothetical protein RFI_03501 [Reticulomyxa filosa]|uniref:DNA polymerase alpha subunit B n=1 Tax=Reticulomyxa filosa TaxID=46433 RepID=X6P7I9_RETFI|nr:hypothetical protein RFI_03501 [Reticulomyxa filosa]|eukprot:ETO33602.1 hypothetical protein RFI_03501 [Reticulomyxa filosa]
MLPRPLGFTLLHNFFFFVTIFTKGSFPKKKKKKVEQKWNRTVKPSSSVLNKVYSARKNVGKTEHVFNDHLPAATGGLFTASETQDNETKVKHVLLEYIDTWKVSSNANSKEQGYRFMYEDACFGNIELRDSLGAMGGSLVTKIESEIEQLKKAKTKGDTTNAQSQVPTNEDAVKGKGVTQFCKDESLSLTVKDEEMLSACPNLEQEHSLEVAIGAKVENECALADPTPMTDPTLLLQTGELDTKMDVKMDMKVDIKMDVKVKSNGEEIEEFALPVQYVPVDEPSQRPSYFLGRIISLTDDEKLQANGIGLEGDWDTSLGKKVTVNVSQLKEYALFPGQQVVVYGVNSNGREILARAVFSNGVLPKHLNGDPFRWNALQCFQNDPLQIIVACGPFTPLTSLDFDNSPFQDLAKVVIERRPHVLILTGPFMDRSNECIKRNTLGTTLQEQFEGLLSAFTTLLRSSNVLVEIILIPSPQDVHHICAYPQPPYTIEEPSLSSLVHCFSNPCQFHINNIGFGVNSADFLLHCLGAGTTKKVGAEKKKRCQTVASHCIHQQKLVYLFVWGQLDFYPLEPCHPSIRKDVSFHSHLNMAFTPDILILPSVTQHFVEVIDENGRHYSDLIVKCFSKWFARGESVLFFFKNFNNLFNLKDRFSEKKFFKKKQSFFLFNWILFHQLSRHFFLFVWAMKQFLKVSVLVLYNRQKPENQNLFWDVFFKIIES